MERIADAALLVSGGVDTHGLTHAAAVVDQVGRVLGSEEFAASANGYKALLAWMRRFGALVKVGVEGTGSYGAGLARYLAAEGVEVVEVIRPNRQTRRRRGKSDPVDAVAAAIAALNGEASGTPKAKDGPVEALRALQVARRGAVKASTQAANQLRDLLVTAPEQLRAKLGPLPTGERVTLAARFRPGELQDPGEATKAALAAIARRYQQLQAEIAQLDAALELLVPAAAPPAFLAKQGVGPRVAATLLTTLGDNPKRLGSEASFAALCGASPLDASSGKQRRHRLNPGGDRQANSALWRIAITRMSHDPRTKDYVARRTAEGKTTREITRCLKRYIARELYKTLIGDRKPPADVAPSARQATPPEEAHRHTAPDGTAAAYAQHTGERKKTPSTATTAATRPASPMPLPKMKHRDHTSPSRALRAAGPTNRSGSETPQTSPGPFRQR